MQPGQNYKKYLILISVVIVAIIGVYLYNSGQFRVTGTTPNHKSYPASLGIMKIHFNRPLDTDKLEAAISQDVTSVVKLNFDSAVTVTVDETALNLAFTQTPLPGKYHIELVGIPAADGTTLSTRLPFVVKDIPYQKLNNTEQELHDQQAIQGGHTEIIDRHPEVKQLPHATDEYQISLASQDHDELAGHEGEAPTLIISMKFFAPGSNARPATPAEQAAYVAAIRKHRQEAIDWLRANGFNLDEYALTYSEPEIQNEFPRGKAE